MISRYDRKRLGRVADEWQVQTSGLIPAEKFPEGAPFRGGLVLETLSVPTSSSARQLLMGSAHKRVSLDMFDKWASESGITVDEHFEVIRNERSLLDRLDRWFSKRLSRVILRGEEVTEFYGAMVPTYIFVINNLLRLAGDDTDQSFVDDHKSIEEILHFVERFPLAKFGSPPSQFLPMKTYLKGAAGTAVLLVGMAEGKPVLVLLTAGTTFAFWFMKPTARVTRRWFTSKWADRIGTEFRESDED